MAHLKNNLKELALEAHFLKLNTSANLRTKQFLAIFLTIFLFCIILLWIFAFYIEVVQTILEMAQINVPLLGYSQAAYKELILACQLHSTFGNTLEWVITV